MKYNDPLLSVDDLINHLLTKGLKIEDLEYATKMISKIGYHRFRSYFGSFITVSNNTYRFNNDIKFYDILDVYEFDGYLRIALFESIAKIEVAVKTIMNTVMCENHGAHWYLNRSLFKPEFINSTNPDFLSKYDELIQHLRDECQDHKKGREDSAIKRYCNHYTDPDLPPSWMALEIFSLGKISIIYENILPTDCRAKIAHFFGSHDNIIESWLRSISYVRNLCAHHSRLAYRTLLKAPILPKKKSNIFLKEQSEVDANSIYFLLCCIQYMLKKIDSDSFLKNYLDNAFSDFPSIDKKRLGFTDNWEAEEIWR